jgi:hypothetical protein
VSIEQMERATKKAAYFSYKTGSTALAFVSTFLVIFTPDFYNVNTNRGQKLLISTTIG